MVLLLRIRGKQIHASYHWNGPLPPVLNVAIHAADLGALFISIYITISAVFMQKCIFCSVLCMQFCHFLRNGVLPGNELPIVRDGPRSRAPSPSSGLDRGCFCGSQSCVCGWCGWLREACWGDRRCAVAGCWRQFLCRKKCFSHLLFWCHLAKQVQNRWEWWC